MKSMWGEVKTRSDELEEFLASYEAYENGATASPDRLILKINRSWGLLPLAKKRDWTDRLISAGKVIGIKGVIDEFNGVILKFL